MRGSQLSLNKAKKWKGWGLLAEVLLRIILCTESGL